jgi:outer membrane protein TolC
VLLGVLLAGSLAWAGEPAVETYPVTLAECYRQVLVGNADVAQAKLELERAAGTKLTFVARALPRGVVSTQVGAGVGTRYGNGGPFAFVVADAAQPLVDAGLPAAVRRGNVEVIIAQQNLHSVASARLHAARWAYLRGLQARDLLQIYREVEARLEANTRFQREQLAVGLIAKGPVRQAEIQVLNLQVYVAQLERDQRAAGLDLATLLGTTATTGAVVRLPVPADKLEYLPVTVDVAAESARAVAQRPDLALLRAWIRAAREDQRMIQSGYFPFVNLVLSSRYVPSSELLNAHSSQAVPGRDQRLTETLFGGALTWRVVDNGAVAGASRRVESGRQALEIYLRKLEENVLREVTVVAGQLERIAAKLAALRATVAEAEELLQLAEQRVKLGTATQLDFRNAQGNLLSTQAGLVQAAFENAVARAELDRITGRYLDPGVGGER